MQTLFMYLTALQANGGAGTIGVGDGLDDLELAREVVELDVYKRQAQGPSGRPDGLRWRGPHGGACRGRQ